MVTIPDEIYHDACVHSTEEAIASCQVVGYPAMIKASWGGGGKGIRKVEFLLYTSALFFCADTFFLIAKWVTRSKVL